MPQRCHDLGNPQRHSKAPNIHANPLAVPLYITLIDHRSPPHLSRLQTTSYPRLNRHKTMSPFHHWHRNWANMHHMHYHRGPSRFIWFIVGAAAATWYHNRPRDSEFKRSWGHCGTVRVLPPMKEGETEEENWQQANTDKAQQGHHHRFEWKHNSWNRDQQRSADPTVDAPQAPANVIVHKVEPVQAQPQPQQPVSPAPTWPWDSQAADEVMAEMSKRASETLSELSNTLQSFNAKLAEREKERKEMERKKEEERLNPPRFV